MKISNLKQGFQHKTFNLDIKEIHLKSKHINLLIGHNGSGKTTLLKAIVAQKNKANDTKVNLMLQNPYFFKGSVLNNIKLVLKLNKSYEDENNLLELLKLNQLKYEDASSLSGGQKQRLALGLSLASGADLILLDEPFNNVDITSYHIMMEAIKTYPNITFLIVSHQLKDVKEEDYIYHILDSGLLIYSGSYHESIKPLISKYLRKE